MVQEPGKQPTEANQEASASLIPPAEYIKAVRAHIRNGKQKHAYSILLQAEPLYPDNPFILSYLGWLQAVVDKKHQRGLATCRKAFVIFKSKNTRTREITYPILYLNLGRTFLASGRKKDAFENFSKGLQYDRGNYELRKEMHLLGTRKPPLVSFLARSNPINKYIGKIFQSEPQSSRPRSG